MTNSHDFIEFPGGKLDLANELLVTDDNRRVRLTKKEFAILKCLMEQPGKLVRRSVLWNVGWQDDEIKGKIRESNRLDQFILALRNKFRLLGFEGLKIIENDPGKGFKFVLPVIPEVELPITQEPQPKPASPPPKEHEAVPVLPETEAENKPNSLSEQEIAEKPVQTDQPEVVPKGEPAIALPLIELKAPDIQSTTEPKLVETEQNEKIQESEVSQDQTPESFNPESIPGTDATDTTLLSVGPDKPPETFSPELPTETSQEGNTPETSGLESQTGGTQEESPSGDASKGTILIVPPPIFERQNFSRPIPFRRVVLCFVASLFVLTMFVVYKKYYHVPAAPIISKAVQKQTTIVVLKFDSATPNQIGETIASDLAKAKGIHSDIKILGIPEVIHARGDAGKATALDIGHKYNADAVIWGWIGSEKKDPIRVSFVPVSFKADLLNDDQFTPIEEKTSTDELSYLLASYTKLVIAWDRFLRDDFDGAEKAFSEDLLVFTNSTSPAEAANLYYRGHYRQLDPRGAIRDFTLALDSSPNEVLKPLLLASRAKSYADNGYYAEAAKDCRQLLSERHLFLSSDQVQLCFAVEQQIGDSKAVASFAQYLLVKHPATINAHLRNAMFYAKSCHPNEAQGELKSAEVLDSTSTDVAEASRQIKLYVPSREKSETEFQEHPVNQFAFYYRNKKYDQALRVANNLADRVPSATAHWLRYAAHTRLGNHKEAIIDLTRAIALAPSNTAFYKDRAQEFIELNNLRDASSDLGTALRFDNSDAETHLLLAGVSFALKRDSEATDEINHALRLQPTYAQAFRVLGDRAVNEKNWRSALNQYNRVINLSNQSIPPFHDPARWNGCFLESTANFQKATDLQTRAEIFMELHDLLHAKADLQLAEQLAPKEPRIYRSKSKLNKAQNNYEAALGDIHTAIALDTDEERRILDRDAEGLVLLKWSSFEQSQRKYDAALEHVKAAIDLKGSNEFRRLAYSQEGELLIEMNQPGLAINVLSEVLKLDSRDQDALNLQAAAYERLGRWQDAIKNYDILLAVAPEKAALWHKLKANNLLQMKLYPQAAEELNMASNLLHNNGAGTLKSRAK
jgi:tetratricopeptide (TPR) repeat protein/DNA-binding winged helix-turn-helix (wHTH) protein